MKSTKIIIALAALSASALMSTSSFAQGAVTKADVQADLQAYDQSGLANFGRGNDTVDTNSAAYKAAEQRYDALRGVKDQTQPVTRQQVEDDLKAYNESGLAEFWRGDSSPDTNSPAYQAAEQRYQALRGHHA